MSVQWVNFTDGRLNCDDNRPIDGTDVEYNNGAAGDRTETYTCTLTTVAGVPIQGAYIDAEIVSGTNKDNRAGAADYNDLCRTDANGRCNTAASRSPCRSTARTSSASGPNRPSRRPTRTSTTSGRRRQLHVPGKQHRRRRLQLRARRRAGEQRHLRRRLPRHGSPPRRGPRRAAREHHRCPAPAGSASGVSSTTSSARPSRATPPCRPSSSPAPPWPPAATTPSTSLDPNLKCQTDGCRDLHDPHQRAERPRPEPGLRLDRREGTDGHDRPGRSGQRHLHRPREGGLAVDGRPGGPVRSHQRRRHRPFPPSDGLDVVRFAVQSRPKISTVTPTDRRQDTSGDGARHRRHQLPAQRPDHDLRLGRHARSHGGRLRQAARGHVWPWLPTPRPAPATSRSPTAATAAR